MHGRFPRPTGRPASGAAQRPFRKGERFGVSYAHPDVDPAAGNNTLPFLLHAHRALSTEIFFTATVKGNPASICLMSWRLTAFSFALACRGLQEAQSGPAAFPG